MQQNDEYDKMGEASQRNEKQQKRIQELKLISDEQKRFKQAQLLIEQQKQREDDVRRAAEEKKRAEIEEERRRKEEEERYKTEEAELVDFDNDTFKQLNATNMQQEPEQKLDGDEQNVRNDGDMGFQKQKDTPQDINATMDELGQDESIFNTFTSRFETWGMVDHPKN